MFISWWLKSCSLRGKKKTNGFRCDFFRFCLVAHALVWWYNLTLTQTTAWSRCLCCCKLQDEQNPNQSTNDDVPPYLLSLSTALYDEDVGVNVLHTHPVRERESGVGPHPVHHSPKLHQEWDQAEPGSNVERHRGIQYKYIWAKYLNNKDSNWGERGNGITFCWHVLSKWYTQTSVTTFYYWKLHTNYSHHIISYHIFLRFARLNCGPWHIWIESNYATLM